MITKEQHQKLIRMGINVRIVTPTQVKIQHPKEGRILIQDKDSTTVQARLNNWVNETLKKEQ